MPFDDTPTTTAAATGRITHLILAGVIGLAFVGFVVGLRQGKTILQFAAPAATQSQSHPDAIRATAYRDYDRRAFGINREWQNALASLSQPHADLFDESLRSETGRQEAHARRAARRAFDGAPPVVPHPIDQMSAASCVACHGAGLSIGKGVHAPMMSHDFMPNCTQCHVELHPPDLDPFVLTDNTFEGRFIDFGGHRAWTGAPPVIPHSTLMRENCMSCHGPSGPDPIRTTHPWRVNCLQCHAPSAVLDQLMVNDRPTWLPSIELDER